MANENGSFTLKRLEARVTLRAGEFAGGGNTKVITGVPLRARIEKTGPPDFCKATIEARGLRYEDMEKLSTLAFRPLFTAFPARSPRRRPTSTPRRMCRSPWKP